MGGINMLSLSKFSERFIELMQNDNKTAKQMAELLNTDESTVSRWKEGKMSIKLSKAILISVHFKCSLEYLFGRNEEFLDFDLKPTLPFYTCLREIMKARGITRYRVVKDLSKSNGHFDHWKKGGDPFVETVAELADFIGCTLDNLVGREK